MKRLRGKRVLITGASRGIGLAMARSFAGEGAEVILTDISEELNEAQSKLSAEGHRCHAHRLDVTDHAAARALRDQLDREGGPINVLVNNAGVVFGGPFLDIPLEKHLLTYRVNIEAVVAMTHIFLPHLIASVDAHLVNIASASGLIGLPRGSTYASSKWAVIGFSESIRQELAQHGGRHVGVTTVCPSFVSTGMFAGARAPLLTPFLTAETVAAKTLAAVKRNQPFVLEPWLVKITPALMSTLPTFVTDRISWLVGASTSMAGWRGHGETA